MSARARPTRLGPALAHQAVKQGNRALLQISVTPSWRCRSRAFAPGVHTLGIPQPCLTNEQRYTNLAEGILANPLPSGQSPSARNAEPKVSDGGPDRRPRHEYHQVAWGALSLWHPHPLARAFRVDRLSRPAVAFHAHPPGNSNVEEPMPILAELYVATRTRNTADADTEN